MNVGLPFSGQILGGAQPDVASHYQMLMLVLIVASSFLGVAISVQLAVLYAQRVCITVPNMGIVALSTWLCNAGLWQFFEQRSMHE
jgi:hypothetical protein